MSYNKVINKENLDLYFSDFGKLLKKKSHSKNLSIEIVVVGGASVLLNYNFRNTTVDIDCIDVHNALMNEIVSEIANKYDLPSDWINTDFKATESYSQKLITYSTYYKTFNGVLNVRTIKGEYLVAMKIVSGRKYKNDYSDIYGIIKWHKDNNEQLSMPQIDKAIDELYSSHGVVNKDAYEFASKIIENVDSVSIESIKQNEIDNLQLARSKANSISEDNLNQILKKI